MHDETFIYGTHYHRPPNPPREQHGFHLEKIRKELDFNLAKFRVQWNYIEPSRGTLQLDEIREMFDLCDANGLRVLLEINLETAPYWLERKHPETRYVSANGHAMELGGYDATQAGGYPGLCFHNEVVRDEAGRYLKALIAAVKDRPSLYGYDCWNEPHLEPVWQCNYWGNTGDRVFCYCDASKEAFRGWLAAKYGDIGALNRTWARAYAEWEDVNPPSRHGNYADWLDWMRFWFDSLAEHMRWRYDTIKSCDPGRFVMSHSGAVPPLVPRANACIHNWKLAREVDAWGTSFAPKFFNWSFADANAILEATRSAARGKEWWISEMTGGCLYDRGFRNKMPYTRPKDVRAWNWLGAAAGAKGILYWCYLTESTGPEAGGFGLIRLNGETTERAREAARQKALMNRYFPIFRDFSPQTQVAMLYDPDNSSLLWAMENSDELYGQSFIGYSRVLFRQDLCVRYVTYETIDDVCEDVLIVPMCLTLPEDVARKIEAFVARGGVLISDCRMGLFNERGFLQPELPSFGLDKVAGLREEESFTTNPDYKPTLNNPDGLPWPDPVYGGPKIEVTAPAAASMQTAEFFSPLRLEGAECIGRCEGMAAAAHNRFGRGKVYYFGSYAGISLYRGDKETEKIVNAILERHATPVVRGGALRPRLMSDGKEALLCVFNEDRLAPQCDRIRLPEPWRAAVDIFSGKEIPITDGGIDVTVDAEDAAVLHLTFYKEEKQHDLC